MGTFEAHVGVKLDELTRVLGRSLVDRGYFVLTASDQTLHCRDRTGLTSVYQQKSAFESSIFSRSLVTTLTLCRCGSQELAEYEQVFLSILLGLISCLGYRSILDFLQLVLMCCL